MEKYPYTKLEKKWQTYWDKNKTFCVTEDKSFPKNKRLYVLDMFPYPSGAGLHVGHPEGYTATDVYSRFKRMNGYNVLHPMGFDSFGLPAENYAIQTGTHPAITTSKNIANFTRQIKSLGFSYDWSREVITSDPKYYKWTQFIFKKLYEKGLAYESEEPINFCPSCKTGLANEEVHDGKCERCGSQVIHKPIRQWILKITSYAERLLEDLDTLDWPDSVKEMQKNWIGKSIGANVDFKAENGSKITVFTTRPDTLFGATYLVVSPEYKDIKKLVAKEKEKEVLKYCEEASKKSDLERTDLAKTKTGVFSGSYAINPLNNKKIPIWVADYVLSSYGTGAIMAVPAHDDRDWEFAKKFNLPIIAVLEGGGDCKSTAYTGDGKHINSEFLNGLNKQEAIDKAIEFLEKNKIGQKTINYKLRDWVFSRQRFWGEPIPLVHCPKCGTVPLEDKDLPLELPKTDSFKPSEDGSSPLSNIKGFVNAKCPKCGSKATRETNTMPQWAGSCWYYLRYLDPLNNKEFCSKEKEKYWMPVALYVGGAEHAVLHLLYARFWHKVLYDLGLVSTKEPFQKLVNQGLITAFAYQKKDKALVPVDTVEEKGDKFFIKETHEEVNRVIAKMSKSLKNVINPDDIIKDHGADALRLYELFLGPLEVSKPWSTTGIAGIDRFLERSWALHQAKKITDKMPTEDLYKLLHKTIQKVTQDIDTLNFNTGISSLMILLNAISKEDELNKSVYESYILLLSPYAPHLCEELWERLGHKTSIAKAPWPQVDKKALTDNEVNISVQINSKVRSNIKVRKDLSNDEVLKLAKSDDKVKKWLDGATIVKEIVVPNRTVNIVVKK